MLGHGVGTKTELSKKDAGNIAWAQRIQTTYFWGGCICFQPFGNLAKQAELLVVTAENKLVNNLPYQLGHPSMRVAPWGPNLQGDANTWLERFMARVARRADWWFGYTEMNRPLITRSGFPDECITILHNSVNTAEMQAHIDGFPSGDRAAWRKADGVGGWPVGMFLGLLYAEI